MNTINCVSRNWFNTKQVVFVEDYDAIWYYNNIEFGILISRDQVCVDVLSARRWRRDASKREQVGAFIFAKHPLGWTVEQASLLKKYQGFGLGNVVYLMLAQNGYPVVSGSSMSPGALKMWTKLCNENEVMTKIKGQWYQVTGVGNPMDLLEENRLVLWG